MTDPRISPSPKNITCNEPARVVSPMVNLTRGMDGPRDRQLMYGENVTILGRAAEHCLIRAEKDGYCGTLPAMATAPRVEPTHKVTARTTHAYEKPDFKSADVAVIPFGSLLRATSETATFIETELGFIPRQHVHQANALAEDPAAIATLFLGTPYLWGGNSYLGIDCSGLIQAACLACGIACPGDSDLQADHLGKVLPETAVLQRNDVIFWKGHVALVSDENTLIHANAGHMAVVFEPIIDAIQRIEQQGDGLPTVRKRLL